MTDDPTARLRSLSRAYADAIRHRGDERYERDLAEVVEALRDRAIRIIKSN
jgi:hypothetical protein